MTNTITLTKRERMELMRRATSRTGRAEDARRAWLIMPGIIIALAVRYKEPFQAFLTIHLLQRGQANRSLLRATFSPAHPLVRRDVPVTQTRAFGGRALREQGRLRA